MEEISKLVSILTPCYNGGKYIHKLLNSVLSQTYPNIEMIVIDDGSTDDSSEIIKSFVSRFKKKGYRLKYVYQKNQGLSYAINNGLKLVTGEYFVWPDADDYYSSKLAITKMVNALDVSDDSTSMVRVQYDVVDEDGTIIHKLGVNDETRYKTDLFEDCLLGTNDYWYPSGGKMAKMSKVDECIPSREIYTRKDAGQNFQLQLPLLYGHECLTIEEYLYTLVSHEDSMSRDVSTNNMRQKAYYDTRTAVMRSINLPLGYRKYLMKKVRELYKTSIINKQAPHRVRATLRRGVKALMPYGAIVLLRKKGILTTPSPQTQIVFQVPEKSLLDNVSDYDNKIFERGYAHDDLSKVNLDGWMLFCSHVLEKAMSREKFEAGHNIFRLEQLRDFLNDYEAKKIDKKTFAYEYALSSIKEYILLHEKNGFPTDKIKEIIGGRYDEALRAKKNLSGYLVIDGNEKKNNKDLNFINLQNNRFSVREFSNEEVAIEDIRKAINLSMKTPSICNRQGVRVYNIMDKEKMRQILEIQGGFGGYETPSCLLLITHDTQTLVGVNERNQGFIDGGLFSMSLLLSLEYYSLAACSLNAMFMPDTDQKVKEILNISNSEYLIMFIAVGHFKDKNKVAVSTRISSAAITKEYL